MDGWSKELVLCGQKGGMGTPEVHIAVGDLL